MDMSFEKYPRKLFNIEAEGRWGKGGATLAMGRPIHKRRVLSNEKSITSFSSPLIRRETRASTRRLRTPLPARPTRDHFRRSARCGSQAVEHRCHGRSAASVRYDGGDPDGAPARAGAT